MGTAKIGRWKKYKNFKMPYNLILINFSTNGQKTRCKTLYIGSLFNKILGFENKIRSGKSFELAKKLILFRIEKSCVYFRVFFSEI